QAALEPSAQAADGTVEVTVNAQGQVVKTVIDESFLDDHDFDDLGDYVTEAAQTAAKDAGRRVAEMLAPINERHGELPSFFDVVAGLPDARDLMPPGFDAFGPAASFGHGSSAGGLYDDGDDGRGGAEFPTVRR